MKPLFPEDDFERLAPLKVPTQPKIPDFIPDASGGSPTPGPKVLVALWTGENAERASARLQAAGADVVATRLGEVIDQLRQLAVPAGLELQRQNQGRTTISGR